MQSTRELQVHALQAPRPQGGQQADLVRLTELVRQTWDMIQNVNDARDGVMLVRRASAADKLVTEALKGCRMLDAEQFTLRQAAAEAHLRTQRRAGELLASMEKHSGGRPPKTGITKGRVSGISTLADLGITRNEAHRWQLLATLTEEQFEDYLADCHSRRRELTTIGALARARYVVRERSALLERPSGSEAQLARYEKIKRALSDMIWLDPALVVAAMEPARRSKESEDADRAIAWLEHLKMLLDERERRR